MVRGYIEERTIQLAKFISTRRCTVRDAAKEFGISKSTVHKDVTEKLCHFDPDLFEEVRKILDINKAERHLRGGEATRVKYQAKQK